MKKEILKERITKVVSSKKNITIGVLSIVLIGTMAHDISLSGQLKENKKQVTQLEETIEENKSTIDRLEKENTNLSEEIEKNIIEEKINNIVKELQNYEDKVSYEVNKNSDETIISAKVEYDSEKNAIVIKCTTKFLNYEDKDALTVLRYNEKAFGACIESLETDYDYAKSILKQQSIDDVEVIVEQYVGEYKAFTYTKNINGAKIDF